MPANATPLPAAGLLADLTLADGEMAAVQTSTTLSETQAHAQAAIDTLVGALGRWYSTQPVDDPSDRRGVLPGERVPGPANDTPQDWSPVGWGLRVYYAQTPQTQPVAQAILGDINLWINNPRSGYDGIERAVAATNTGEALAGRLAGYAPRAVAWARLIQVKAATLDQARQFGAAGQKETQAALAAANSLPH